jgi:MFS family permease
MTDHQLIAETAAPSKNPNAPAVLPDQAPSARAIATPAAELSRIGFTGTIWFAAAVIGAGVPLAGLLARGWRPHDLPEGAEFVWWIGFALILIALGSLAWAGCPVLRTDVPSADRQKSVWIRVGVVAFMIGAAAATLAVLAG